MLCIDSGVAIVNVALCVTVLVTQIQANNP